MINEKKCILLVEDDAFIATSEAMSLKEYGYEVLTAPSAKKGIELVRANPGIDLVLMDINLGSGKMSGTEAAEIILQVREIPIVFLSNRTENEILEETGSITSYGYVVKNSGPGAINSAVKVALRLFDERERVQKQQDELKTAEEEYIVASEELEESQLELLESEKRIREQNHLLDAIEQSVIVTDLTGRITFWNSHAEKLYGWKREEALGKTTIELISSVESRERGREIMERLRKGKSSSGEYLVRDRRGREFPVHVTTSPIHDDKGELSAIIGISHDISGQKNLENRLLGLNRVLNEAERIAGAGSWEWDAGTGETIWSQGLYRIFGRNPADGPVSIDDFLDHVHREDREKFHGALKRSFETGTFEVEYRKRSGDGGGIQYIHACGEAVIENGRAIRHYGVVIDITETRERELRHRETIEAMERQQKEQEALLGAARAVLECHTFEEAARRIFDACCGVTGAVSGYVALMSEKTGDNEVLFLEAGGMPCDVDPDLPMPIRGLRAVSYHEKRTVYENDFMNSDYVDYMPEGHVEMKNVMFAPLILEGRVVGIIGLANKPADFTDKDAEIAGAFGDIAAIALQRSWTEEKLNRSLKEKDALFHELQHRVKNSMTAIAGIIDLELMKAVNPDTRETLDAVSSRVMSMSELYLMLYESGSVDSIVMGDYCGKVVESLSASRNTGDGSVRTSLDCDDITLDIKRAMPVGLIVTEILTNAYKHSFPEERAGTVSVSLKRKDGRLALTVSDNGIGASDDELAGKGGSGLEIVRGLVDQIDGTMTMDGSGGMTVEIMFPEDD